MGTLTRTTATIMLAFALAGCAGKAAMQDQLTFCDGAQPIRPAPGETAKLSDSLVGQLHEQNALGAKACGWKP